MAGLESGTIDENFNVSCHGGANFYGRFFKCWVKGGHGSLNVHGGIVHSCDVFFYTVGNKIGIDGIAEYAEQAGLGKKTGIDLPGEAEGLMPSSKWKLRTQREKWYAGETISVAIGQGAVTVTPIQLATAIGGMANGGVWFKPHLVQMAAPADPRKENWNPDNIAKVVSGMYGVVNEPGGTGDAARIPGITVSGKTGSAQRVSNDLRKSGKLDKDELEDNGWFVAFAPRENPEIVVAVLVESGIHGGLVGAPTARDVIKAYFDKKTRLSRLTQPNLALIRRPGVTMPAVH